MGSKKLIHWKMANDICSTRDVLNPQAMPDKPYFLGYGASKYALLNKRG